MEISKLDLDEKNEFQHWNRFFGDRVMMRILLVFFYLILTIVLGLLLFYLIGNGFNGNISQLYL